MSKKVIFKVENNIAFIILNNPNILNACDYQMRSEIITKLKKIKSNKNTKALIITGKGNKAFCSGQDLKEINKFNTSKKVEQWINQFKVLYREIRSLEIPSIAAINGVAAGSGFQLALLADIRVSYPKTRMGQVEINSGIVSVIGPWIIEKVLGLSKAIELSITGKLINGNEAYKIGAINYLTKQKDVLNRSISIAKDLATKPKHAMILTKKNLWEMYNKDFDMIFKRAKVYHQKSFKLGDPVKGSKKFLNKN